MPKHHRNTAGLARCLNCQHLREAHDAEDRCLFNPGTVFQDLMLRADWREELSEDPSDYR